MRLRGRDKDYNPFCFFLGREEAEEEAEAEAEAEPEDEE